MNLLKPLLLCFIFFTITVASHAQINYGVLSGYDLYQRFVNPDDLTGTDRSAGSAILNSSLGGKLWLGGQKMSLSLESYANLGFLSFNIEEYYGMGSFHLPIMAKLNFKGLTGFSVLKRFGYYVGGGWQINKTELYGLNDKARSRGVQRPFYNTYIVEIGLGNGNKTKLTEFFVRLGLNPELNANSLNIGFNTSYSIPNFKVPKFNMDPGKEENDEIIKM